MLGLYFRFSTVGSPYGAAGSLVVILVWLYYSAQILFLGTEFTQVYANRHGSEVRPADNAVRVVTERQEIQEAEAPPEQGGGTANLSGGRVNQAGHPIWVGRPAAQCRVSG